MTRTRRVPRNQPSLRSRVIFGQFVGCPHHVQALGVTVLVPVLVLAISVAVLGALAMAGTGGLRGNPIQAAIMFIVLPLIAAYGFVTLGTISGG